MTSLLDAELKSPFSIHAINETHTNILGELMDISYRDSIDYEGETLAQCIQEMSGTIAGKHGTLIREASFIIKSDQIPASAVLVTEWKGEPLVAYTMSNPRFRGQGLAKCSMRKAISALYSLGRNELFLVVTEGNTQAEALYQKMGFEKVGPTKQPPPVSE